MILYKVVMTVIRHLCQALWFIVETCRCVNTSHYIKHVQGWNQAWRKVVSSNCFFTDNNIRGRPRRTLGRSLDCWAMLLHRRMRLLLYGRAFSALSFHCRLFRMVWKVRRWVPRSCDRWVHLVVEGSGRDLCCPWTWVGRAGTQCRWGRGSA